MLTFSHPGSGGQKGTQSRIRNTGWMGIREIFGADPDPRIRAIPLTNGSGSGSLQ
jgi:hypothetical protein